MEAAIAHYEEVRRQRLAAQDQLVKMFNRINESTVNLKRFDAELEELDTVDRSAVVMKQLGRIFVEQSADGLRKSVQAEVAATEDGLPRLRELCTGFQDKVAALAKQSALAEEALARVAKEAQPVSH